jgi:hypothetical protein
MERTKAELSLSCPGLPSRPVMKSILCSIQPIERGMLFFMQSQAPIEVVAVRPIRRLVG